MRALGPDDAWAHHPFPVPFGVVSPALFVLLSFFFRSE